MKISMGYFMAVKYFKKWELHKVAMAEQISKCSSVYNDQVAGGIAVA